MYPNLQIIVKWISCYHIPLLCGPFSSTWKADCILLDSRTNTISDGETYNRLQICFLFDWYSMNRFLIVKKYFHRRSATNVRQLTCHRVIFVIWVCKRSTCDVIMFTRQGLKTRNSFLVSLVVFKRLHKKSSLVLGLRSPSSLTVASKRSFCLWPTYSRQQERICFFLSTNFIIEVRIEKITSSRAVIGQ